MTGPCPVCSATLGPAEDPRGCLTCRNSRPWDNRDGIVAVLESAAGPLAYWDVKRLLDSKGGTPAKVGSVKSWLATDPRTCWGGPGIYGLYRHGLLPTVRDIGSAAAVFIHAAGVPVTQEQARFVLQHVGYRFLSTSIYYALRGVEYGGLLRQQRGLWAPTSRSMRRVLRLWMDDDIDAVMTRAAEQADDALATWAERQS